MPTSNFQQNTKKKKHIVIENKLQTQAIDIYIPDREYTCLSSCSVNDNIDSLKLHKTHFSSDTSQELCKNQYGGWKII